MENASKALIIAGAILLAILIISLGIMIYNQASGVVNNNNQKFEQYTGTNVRGAQVNSLLSQIQTNNVTYQDDSSRQVKVNVTATNWNGTKPTANSTLVGVSYNKANTGETYKVTYTTDSKTGLIDTITIANAS